MKNILGLLSFFNFCHFRTTSKNAETWIFNGLLGSDSLWKKWWKQ